MCISLSKSATPQRRSATLLLMYRQQWLLRESIVRPVLPLLLSSHHQANQEPDESADREQRRAEPAGNPHAEGRFRPLDQPGIDFSVDLRVLAKNLFFYVINVFQHEFPPIS